MHEMEQITGILCKEDEYGWDASYVA
jgi:hypothetical protein